MDSNASVRLACRLAAALALLAVLSGCGAPGPLIPEQRTGGSADSRPPPAPEAYKVRRGDTLYSIAFGYGLDWRKVAEWNGIGAPYTIQVGEWIRLQPQPDMRPAVVTRTRPSPPPRPEPDPDPEPQRETGAKPAQPTPVRRSESPSDEAAPRAVPRAAPAQPDPEPESAPAARESGQGAPPSAPTRSVAGVVWRWPTEGPIARGFDAGASRKGILIGGERGQPVRAAAQGEVVYSGNGLIGYGELIIIKHSDRMLSAYAHNRERLVGEGDRVQSGQLIARMGTNERDQNVLHFEIRRDGKPTDPVQFLPAR